MPIYLSSNAIASILLVARLMLASLFILSGFGKITGFSDTAAYMGSVGLPMPTVLLILTIMVEFGGGIMVAVGWKARLAALALFLFIIVVTLVFHNFWAVPPDQMQTQMIQFLKNISIMGGMLYIVVVGPGRFSLDRR